MRTIGQIAIQSSQKGTFKTQIPDFHLDTGLATARHCIQEVRERLCPRFISKNSMSQLPSLMRNPANPSYYISYLHNQVKTQLSYLHLHLFSMVFTDLFLICL
jgi:hypothetical protein